MFFPAKRNKARRDISAFAALIATPTVGSLVLPANGYIEVSFSNAVTQGDIYVEVFSRAIYLPTLVAGQFHQLGWFERAADFTLSILNPGVLTFYVADGMGARFEIARSA